VRATGAGRERLYFRLTNPTAASDPRLRCNEVEDDELGGEDEKRVTMLEHLISGRSSIRSTAFG